MARPATPPPSMPAVDVGLRPDAVVLSLRAPVPWCWPASTASEASRAQPAAAEGRLELVEKIFTPPVFSCGESRLMLDTVRPVIPAMQLRCSLQVR